MFKRIGIVYSLILIAVLCLPALRMIYVGGADGKLNGYFEGVSNPPRLSISSYSNKSFQAWLEGYVNISFGYRALLIRGFNEINFKIFRQIPHLKLYSIDPNGLYSSMSIEALNREIQLRPHVEAEYSREARSLLAIQKYLESQGKVFMVVIAASKPYVHPYALGNKYVLGGTENIYSKAANLGDSLQRAGVNVIDMRPILRRFSEHTNIPTHADTGVHWNYYAGCLAAQEIMRRVQAVKVDAGEVNCGFPVYLPAKWADVDGLLLLNIFTNGGLGNIAPYPNVFRQDLSNSRPSFVFVGDSFLDQIIQPILDANVSSKIVKSGYFRTRELSLENGQFQVSHSKDSEPVITRKTILNDIEKSDVVVLEVVDYQSQIKSFGLTDFYLKQPEVNQFLSQSDIMPDAQLSSGEISRSTQISQVQNCCSCSDEYDILAFVEKNNISNPLSLPGNITFSKNVDDLPGMALQGKPDFVFIS